MPSTAPQRRLIFTIAIVIFTSLGLTLSACTRSVSKDVTLPPTPGAKQAGSQETPQVTIEAVQVNQGEGIYITGRSTLPDGECIQTDLLADGQPVAWWPKDVCVQVDSGRWEMLASLGRKGAPAQLDTRAVYTVKAWCPKQEQATLTQFPLNLNGPKQP